jgi:hypothetical protein
MKRLTVHSLVAAAALTVAAGSASAQMLKAEIPFTFRAGEAVMAPGAYQVTVTQTSGFRHYLLRNTDTGKGALMIAAYPGIAPPAWRADGLPRISFQCAGARCVLRQLWEGYGGPTYNFSGPKLGSEEPVRTAEIVLTKGSTN